MTPQPAIWLSRHAPTADQIADAKRLGYDITAIAEGQHLGSIDLRDEGDVKALVAATLGLCAEHNARAIFGVVAAPLAAQLHRTANDAVQRGEWGDDATGGEWGDDATGDVPVFAAWNVQRTAEGGKPTFAHRCWLPVGRLGQASCRWLG